MIGPVLDDVHFFCDPPGEQNASIGCSQRDTLPPFQNIRVIEPYVELLPNPVLDECTSACIDEPQCVRAPSGIKLHQRLTGLLPAADPDLAAGFFALLLEEADRMASGPEGAAETPLAV